MTNNPKAVLVSPAKGAHLCPTFCPAMMTLTPASHATIRQIGASAADLSMLAYCKCAVPPRIRSCSRAHRICSRAGRTLGSKFFASHCPEFLTVDVGANGEASPLASPAPMPARSLRLDAEKEGKSQPYIVRQLCFGRFLNFMPFGINPESLPNR